MRFGSWWGGFAVVTLLGLIGLTTGAAVPDRSGLTWDELKAVEATERVEMLKAQSEEWQGLLAKEAGDGHATSPDELVGAPQGNLQLILEAAKQLRQQEADERKEIAKTFAEERAQLAKTHAQEREAFFSGSNAEKPAP